VQRCYQALIRSATSRPHGRTAARSEAEEAKERGRARPAFERANKSVVVALFWRERAGDERRELCLMKLVQLPNEVAYPFN